MSDNYFAALNSAVFSDGSFVYLPKGVRSPMELSTYFRINASETGQVRAAQRRAVQRRAVGGASGRVGGIGVPCRVGGASCLPTYALSPPPTPPHPPHPPHPHLRERSLSAP